MIVAPLLCVAGITGDLAESVIKRCTAIKDSGHALPGIGGILDLTDSLLFTAPVFYFYLLAIQS
jgi:phosphatidate cytidylyltransferase